MFRIKDNTKIYVLCESKYATGGTEAIHQLVDKLRNLGHSAFVFYKPEVKDPKPESYKKYNTKHVFKVDDVEDNKNSGEERDAADPLHDIMLFMLATFADRKVHQRKRGNHHRSAKCHQHIAGLIDVLERRVHYEHGDQ